MANPKPQPVITPADMETAKSVISALFVESLTLSAKNAPEIRAAIQTLRNGIVATSKQFDDSLTNLRAVNGSDFLPAVSHFRKPRAKNDAAEIDIFS